MSTLNSSKCEPARNAPAWTEAVSEEAYRAAALSGAVLTSGMLKEFRLCPARYRDLITGKDAQKSGDSFRIGRAVHKLVLEGEAAFRGAFVVGGPTNEKTGRSFGAESRAFEQWLDDCGLDRERALTLSEAADIGRMVESLRRHREASRLLTDGWPERSARASLGGVACQIRLDWIRPDGVAVDLKTTSDLARFEADARRFGYLHQFAFYRDVAEEAGAGDLEMFAVVLEKKSPFRVGVWRFARAALASYSAQNRAAVASLARCRETNVWPTGYERARSFPPAGVPPAWLN